MNTTSAFAIAFVTTGLFAPATVEMTMLVTELAPSRTRYLLYPLLPLVRRTTTSPYLPGLCVPPCPMSHTIPASTSVPPPARYAPPAGRRLHVRRAAILIDLVPGIDLRERGASADGRIVGAVGEVDGSLQAASTATRTKAEARRIIMA
jgi:hypothetical protein